MKRRWWVCVSSQLSLHELSITGKGSFAVISLPGKLDPTFFRNKVWKVWFASRTFKWTGEAQPANHAALYCTLHHLNMQSFSSRTKQWWCQHSSLHSPAPSPWNSFNTDFTGEVFTRDKPPTLDYYYSGMIHHLTCRLTWRLDSTSICMLDPPIFLKLQCCIPKLSVENRQVLWLSEARHLNSCSRSVGRFTFHQRQ